MQHKPNELHIAMLNTISKTHIRTDHGLAHNQHDWLNITPCILAIRGAFINFYSILFSEAINLTKKAVKYINDNEEKGEK